MNIKKRVEALRAHMERENIALSIVLRAQNQFYYSDYKAIIYSRPIILAVGMHKASLIVPGLEEDHAKSHNQVDEVLTYYEHPEKVGLGGSQNDFLRALLGALPKGARIGAEFHTISISQAAFFREAGFDLVDIGPFIQSMRNIKDEEEIAMMVEAGKLVSEALHRSIDQVRPGVTEMEMDQFGNAYLMEETPACYPGSTLEIFVMSPGGVERTNMPHVFSNTRKYEQNEIILHSRQVGLNGYRAEIERTMFLGKPSEKQKEVFQIMTEAQQALLDAIRPGMTAGEADFIARSIIQNAGLGQYANHRCGHGIGLGLHEEPYLRYDSTLVLQPGMAFSIEPGIYVPELGGFRHSDTVILREGGNRKITDCKRELSDLIL